MTACASGCTTRGQHAAWCEGDPCRGCLPRVIEDDRTICRQCEGRLRHDLVVAPDLVAHLRVLVEPSSEWRDPDAGGHTGKREPPAPLSAVAVAAADDLHALVASWVLLVMDERDVRGPSFVGSDVRPAYKARISGALTYHPPRVVGVTDAQATAALVSWLLPHTGWAAGRPWAVDMVREVTRQVRTMLARWPMEDRPVYLPVPCPACGCLSLVRYAPEWAGAPVTVACYLADCGHIVDEGRYAWLTRLALGMRGAC